MRRSIALTLEIGFLAVATSTAAAQSQAWIRQIGTSTGEEAQAVATDGSGGLYLGGWTYGSLGGANAGTYDAWLARYDSAGNLVWTRQLGTSGEDRMYAAAADGSGGVYLSGFTTGNLGGTSAGFMDAWLARYDGAGNQSWIRQIGTTFSEGAYAVASDGVGGVYLSGTTTGSLGGTATGFQDAWLARYDGAGNQYWIRQLGTSDDEYMNAAAPDGLGGVFLAGATLGSLAGPTAGGRDAWLTHYDSAGNQNWIRQLGTSGSDSADAAAADGVGGVYVSGDTSGALGGPSAGNFDVWVARYDGAGNQSWTRQFGTSSNEYARAAAPDLAGGVYLSGETFGPPASG